MANKREKNSRAQIKDELKNEVKEYNSNNNHFKQKSKFSIKKEEIDKSGIELTPKQHELYKSIRNNIFTLIQGPAGTSKTFTACYTALCLLADKKIEKIIITKPIQESGENLGFLPGSVSEKTEPFMRSYITNFEKIIGKQSVEYLQSVGDLCVEPLAYMRGVTYDNSIILLDEAQNCTMKQLMLWITRLGKNSKAVLMGDISQYDIRKRDTKFLEFIDMVKGVEDVCTFNFVKEDIVRNKFLIEIVNRYEDYKSKVEN
jgi:phosphate starvation-inducible PhoH-like protein